MQNTKFQHLKSSTDHSKQLYKRPQIDLIARFQDSPIAKISKTHKKHKTHAKHKFLNSIIIL